MGPTEDGSCWRDAQRNTRDPMALEHRQTMTVEEYFLLEKNDPDTRYEYVDGYVYAMAGGSFNHDTIKSNIQRILWERLRGRGCRVYSSDMKVFITRERYFHPDVTVTCHPRDRGRGDLIQFPRLVVEVLSPTTELKDRTWKLQNYTAHPTIEEYILVSSQSMKMELYRKEQDKWVYSAFDGGEEIDLACLAVRFPVAAAYEDVIFGEDVAPEEENEIFPGP
jgi:Uma2 family endonuclease